MDVMTALPPRFPYRPDPDRDRPEPWDPPERRTAPASSKLGEVRHLASHADPRAMIDARRDAELVVVAPRGVSHLHQLMMGSTTDWLLHYSPVPLTVVRSSATTRRVLMCDDDSDHARHATERLARLPWVNDLTITVLTVDEGGDDHPPGSGAVVDRLRATSATVEVQRSSGPPTWMILDEIERTKPDLVVLGTKGLTGWSRIRLGSTAGAVTRLAPCTVMIVGLPDDSVA